MVSRPLSSLSLYHICQFCSSFSLFCLNSTIHLPSSLSTFTALNVLPLPSYFEAQSGRFCWFRHHLRLEQCSFYFFFISSGLIRGFNFEVWWIYSSTDGYLSIKLRYLYSTWVFCTPTNQDFHPGDRCSCPVWNQRLALLRLFTVVTATMVVT